MFAHSSSETVIPTLTFTKAELVYALSVLMADIPPNDNQTRLELVEIRHYLNQIKDKVAQAVSDGTLERAMPHLDKDEHQPPPPEPQAAPMPSMSELRAKFPTLTEEEIGEVLAKARENSPKEEVSNENSPPLPPVPSFISKPKNEENLKPPPRPLTKQESKNRENSIKFSSLLGQV
jgi:hypothetical protein